MTAVGDVARLEVHRGRRGVVHQARCRVHGDIRDHRVECKRVGRADAGTLGEARKGTLVRQERYSGACSRTWYVGTAIRDTDVKAAFENGILQVTVPTEEKKEAEEKKFIDIL